MESVESKSNNPVDSKNEDTQIGEKGNKNLEDNEYTLKQDIIVCSQKEQNQSEVKEADEKTEVKTDEKPVKEVESESNVVEIKIEEPKEEGKKDENGDKVENEEDEQVDEIEEEQSEKGEKEKEVVNEKDEKEEGKIEKGEKEKEKQRKENRSASNESTSSSSSSLSSSTSSSSGDEADGKAADDMDDWHSYTTDDIHDVLEEENEEDKGEQSAVSDSAMLEFVKKGSNLTKVRSRTRRYTRFYRVDYSGVMLTYTGSKRSMCAGRSEEKSQVYMTSIQEVREGTMSDIFVKSFPDGKSALDPARCFSLVIGDENETLDLIAPDPQTQRMWVTSLRHLVRKFSERNLQNIEHIFLKALFRKADKNGDGSLCLKEVIKLLKSLNLQVDTDHASQLFHTANSRNLRNSENEECLDPEEFTNFVQLIRKREELEELFHKYDNKTKFLTAPDLVNFFKEEQEEKVSLSRCKKMIEQCESCPSVRESEKLSLSGFYVLCNSSWMDVKRTKCREVYQDMQQPLSHYFIDSSHNTYLAEDQLRGPSRVECYIQALKMGCRCVELDVWDGDNCEPVIYHGYTFTSKILLRDALKAIKKYAFVASDYPVILSIENHLSLDQQDKMAEYFKTIFKERLLTSPLPLEAKCLPTPGQLKGMIIIKGKKLPEMERPLAGGDTGDGFPFLEDDEVSDEDEAAEIENEEVHRQVAENKTTEHHKHKLSKALSDCVIICQSTSFKSFEQARSKSTFKQMSSLAEGKAVDLARDQGPQFVKHNCWQITRTYPSGMRTDSSNYDPVPLWTVGCQIVALNYQTDDVPMFLNKGMFEENGRSGYVLKPQFMRTGTGRYNPSGPYVPQWKRLLNIKVISGYQLPKKKHDREGSILDPYVKVSVHGVEEDCKKYKTRVISNNGFHPVWNETFSFEVNCPEMALVLFRVYDHETRSRNVAVCQYCLPMRALQTGYRTVHLKALSGEPLAAASLLVHISISQPDSRNSPVSASQANKPVTKH